MNFLNNQNIEESIGFAVNKIYNVHQQGKNVFAITTSLSDAYFQTQVLEYILKKTEKDKIKVEIYNLDLINDSKNKIYSLIEKNQKDNTLTLIAVPPINKYALALEIVKKCDCIISVERYGESLYSNFEGIVEILKENNLKLDGVITCK